MVTSIAPLVFYVVEVTICILTVYAPRIVWRVQQSIDAVQLPAFTQYTGITGVYTSAFVFAMAVSLVSILAMWVAAPRKVRVVTGQIPRLPNNRCSWMARCRAGLPLQFWGWKPKSNGSLLSCGRGRRSRNVERRASPWGPQRETCSTAQTQGAGDGGLEYVAWEARSDGDARP